MYSVKQKEKVINIIRISSYKYRIKQICTRIYKTMIIEFLRVTELQLVLYITGYYGLRISTNYQLTGFLDYRLDNNTEPYLYSNTNY